MIKGFSETAPVTHHAAGLGPAADDFWAICGAGRVVTIPGSFDPAETHACPNCAALYGARTS